MRALKVRVDQAHPQAARIPESWGAVRRGIKELDSWAAVEADPNHILNVLIEYTYRAEAESWPPAVVLMTVVSLWHNKRGTEEARSYAYFARCLRNHAVQTLVAFSIDPEDVIDD